MSSQISACHLSIAAQGEGWIPFGCCNPQGCGHLPIVYQQI
ncbi:hypothetical protein MtrunA17_Chr4g0041711 [Medicago truncatula]|uniref:Uncharacterized protein n=1 Tax=Medicago truncatula TaxID=3880 RepID=A0A396IGE0_MEDTR|nr:hypothetical protein MtrunA17_Chr4g0041711 [Medicago truncatula]